MSTQLVRRWSRRWWLKYSSRFCRTLCSIFELLVNDDAMQTVANMKQLSKPLQWNRLRWIMSAFVFHSSLFAGIPFDFNSSLEPLLVHIKYNFFSQSKFNPALVSSQIVIIKGENNSSAQHFYYYALSLYNVHRTKWIQNDFPWLMHEFANALTKWWRKKKIRENFHRK